MTLERAIDVATFGSEPWNTLTSHVRYGDLTGVLDLSGEDGLAAGMDLSDVTEPNIVATQSRVRIQLRGQAFGCLTFDAGAKTGISAENENELDFYVNNLLRMTLNEEGAIFYGENGIANKAINWTGDAYSTKPDIQGNSIFALGSDASVGVLLDTDNDSTSAVFQIMCNAEAWLDATAVFYVREDERVGMRHFGVAHQATGIVANTDTTFEVGVDDATYGGAAVYGIKDAQASGNGAAMTIYGLAGSNMDTTHDATGRGAIELYGGQLSSGSLQDMISNGNVFVVRARRGGAWESIYMIDEDGDVYRDGSVATYDEEDDAAAISDLYHVLCDEPPTKYSEQSLRRMRALHGTRKKLISEKTTMALTFGAIRQLDRRQKTIASGANGLAARLGDLEARVAQVEARSRQ